MKKSIVRPIIIRLAAPLALISIAACDVTSTGGNRVPVAISFSGQAPAAAAMRALAAEVTVSDAANTLVITRAQLILREIELKRTSSIACADDSTSTDSSSSSDDCEELSIGPFLVDIPLTGNTVTTITATIPPDTYREIEFEIHKLGDETPLERAIAAANPEFGDNSIRVEGTFNGAPFVFFSELNEEIEREFSVPVIITEANQNVTIQFDLATWFRNGSTLVDPVTANKDGANEELVRENIRRSIGVFQDDDRSGR